MNSCAACLRVAAAVLALRLISVLPSLAQTADLRIDLHRDPGYGPFRPQIHVSLPGENGGPWERAVREVRGVPFDLHGFSVRYLNMQMDQYVFQSYREGLIDHGFAIAEMARNGYDTTRLAREQVDQDIPIVAGFDGRGNTVYVVDTKNDHSFWGKDRITVPPFDPDALSAAQMDSLNARMERPEAAFDFYDGKKVREMKVLLQLSPYLKIPADVRSAYRGKIVFGIGTREYRRGLFKVGDADYVAAVSNGFLSGVYGGKDDRFAFIPASDSSDAMPATTLLYRAGDRLEIGNEVFRIGEIAVDGSALTLSREKLSPGGEGIAVGLRARDFDCLTSAGEHLTLSGLRGSYVLLEFWFRGSARCVAELPYLRDVQEAYGKKGLRVIGMCLQEGPPLAAFVTAHRINWTQVPLSDTSHVLRDYAVGGYPAMFLIGPDGTVLDNARLTGAEVPRRLSQVMRDTASFTALIEGGTATFRLRAENRKRVEVSGDFTGWLPLPLYRRGENFERRVNLPPGRHLYLFTVDGEPGPDPDNRESGTSPSGSPCSVLLVR